MKKKADRSESRFRSEMDRICRRLRIDDFRYVEIESKKRVLPEEVKDLKKWLQTNL